MSRMFSILVALVVVCAAVPLAHAQEYDSQTGWKIKPPKGWKFAPQQGRVLFGHDTEAGLIVAWFAPNVNVEQMKQHAKLGLNENGVVLRPTTEPSDLKVRAGSAVEVMLEGMDGAGQKLKARSIGVAGKAGAVGILGLTTPEQFENLSRRVREMADGVSFYTPKAGDAARLAGRFCAYSSTSSGYSSSNYMSSSRTRSMAFDGVGRVGWGSQMLISGQTESSSSRTSVGGIVGDGSSTEFGTYSVVGNTVTIQWASGPQTCVVHFRQQDGTITELKCGEDLWAPGLCD